MSHFSHEAPLVAAVPPAGGGITLFLPDGTRVRLSPAAARQSLVNLERALVLLDARAAPEGSAITALATRRQRPLASSWQRWRLEWRGAQSAVNIPLLAVLALPLVWALTSVPLIAMLASGAARHVWLAAGFCAALALFVSLLTAWQLSAAERRRLLRRKGRDLHAV